MINFLFPLGIVIITLLASYALYLQVKLKKQKTKQSQVKHEAQAKLAAFEKDLIKDIRFIANAMIEKQCDLTEGVLRLQNLICRLDERIWSDTNLEQTQAYYTHCADMPILEAYKQQTKQQKMQQDLKRIKLESQYEQSVLKEMHWLKNNTFNRLNN